ncbi:MAG: M2 family metallopeptidase [Archangiaceae bacterium]|nr:M2 family metallopeptidase [Archangiaceae bacterium]
MIHALSLSFALVAGNMPPPPRPKPPPPAPAAPDNRVVDEKKAAEAKAFGVALNADLKKLWVRSSTAEWIKGTYITDDTERNAAAMNEDTMAFTTQAIKQSLVWKNVKLDPETDRYLYLLRVSQALPAPSDAKKRTELAATAAKLEGMYGKGKWCGDNYTPGKDAEADKKNCKDLGDLSKVLSAVADKKAPSYDEQLAAWRGWHETSKDMRPHYARLVELSNEGAKEIAAKDLGELWRSAYDMSPAEFEAETDRLWTQVKPLYDQLHCYVRGKLSAKYGADKVPATGPIPAHLLGNMWAQEWSNTYPMVEPYAGQPSLDVTAGLQKLAKAKKLDERGLVRIGEKFFTSIGFDPLPPTFWERSQFTKPKDREVVCHASAWDVTYSNDLRIKMCIKLDEEDLITVHHELGHDYYFMQYYEKPVLFQQGANDGFHEAIGDALTLSITPQYLKELGLITTLPKDDKGLINVQMKDALEKIAFLPFGRMIDQWRWDVFSGKVPPSKYNEHWWALRLKYQGIAPAGGARDEKYFDPGAKYHIPANVPYMRYFLARILQFQFHRAMCQAAGYPGPLHTCSIYGNKEAGAKLKAMLAMGASKPWPDALEAITGQCQMDASALVEYFAPLQAWLTEQNKGKQCGW